MLGLIPLRLSLLSPLFFRIVVNFCSRRCLVVFEAASWPLSLFDRVGRLISVSLLLGAFDIRMLCF